jgi:ribonuclease HI
MTGRSNAPEERGAGGRISVYSDGAARGNPGPAGIGGIARDDRGTIIVEVIEYLGEATNNVAEYHALIRILEECAGRGYERIRVYTDSELVANQVAGGFKVKSKDLRPLNARVKALLEGYRQVQVEHIPREKNIECDRLANVAIDEGLAGIRKPVLKTYGEDQLFE